MPKVTLTDRFIKSRKKTAKGIRKDYADSLVPGLTLRVTDSGHKSFVLFTRYPLRPTVPARRSLGDYGAITLERAREKAREWLELIGKGIDPKIHEERQKAAQKRVQANTWEAVVADFLEAKATLAKIKEMKAVLTEFGKGLKWAPRPMADITSLEVSTAIRGIKNRGSPYMAHNALGYVRLLYNWVIGTGLYGVETSPVAGIKPKELIGKRKSRSRTLTDDELRLVWEAAAKLGEPYGPFVRLLIVTGQRLNEIARASKPEMAPAKWREVDPAKVDVSLVIPPQRMKAKAAHVVPLPPPAVELLKSLIEGDEGDFLFSTTMGEKPINGFSKAKARLDAEVSRLRAIARAGEGASVEDGDALPGWVFHDLRRTMRTHLSALPVQDIVRELLIAHTKPSLHKVYDQWAYHDEKREAMKLWAARLKGIVEPASGNVVAIPPLAPARRRNTASKQ